MLFRIIIPVKGSASVFTVLVCDDEKDIVSSLEIYLISEGYKVLTAYSGSQALEILKNSSDVSLVLLDIMMPGLSGTEALMKLREFSNVPVIFTTAKSEDSDIILGLNLGADDYVTKPFNPVELMARVRSQIRRCTMLGAGKEKSGTTVLGGIEIDDSAKNVTVDGDLFKAELHIPAE